MKKMIGCIDSGMGGILMVDALVKAYPNLDIVFIADQKHAPYGEKTKEQLYEYASSMLKEFIKRDIYEVLIACNTICANVFDQLSVAFPQLHLIGIIEPTIQQLPETIQKAGVLATSKTIAAHAYQKAILNQFADMEVIEIACPAIVPLIEEGAQLECVQQAMDEYLKQLGEVDACVLGCTHYPLVREYVQKKLQCPVYDSNQAVIDLFKNESILGNGNIQIYTTHDPVKLEESIQQLIHQNWKVEKISLS